MYELNLERINHRIEAGLALLREHYSVRELPVGIFESFVVDDRRHVVRQFEIDGVGNLVVMTNPDKGKMQMDTFMITPYFKNLPLFTTDYMYFEDRRMVLNEIYDLVEYRDELYDGFISEFAQNCTVLASYPDMPMPPRWYDSIRPVCCGKIVPPEAYDRAFDMFIANLKTFIRMEQASPLLTGEHILAKWERNFAYARSLVEEGGVSTQLFVKALGAQETKDFFYKVFFGTDGYLACSEELHKLIAFFKNKDNDGESNEEKVRKNQKVIRRVDTTDKNRSYEESDDQPDHPAIPSGIVIEDGKIRGFGINIYNKDVYPLQSFEIYLRNCGLTGELELSFCRDMVFLDIYHNKVEKVLSGDMPSLRIFGVQDNLLESIDVTEMPALQGIDAGMNRLTSIDVSKNPELVELYVNDNSIIQIDLSHNPRLKYFYCHNNGIRELDTRNNALLRHLNATGNPMVRIQSLAPQREEALPLELTAGEHGTVGLKYNPVYNAQWKETGEWQQSYYAYPDEGYRFAGWYEADGSKFSSESVCFDEYGASRVLTARFERE